MQIVYDHVLYTQTPGRVRGEGGAGRKKDHDEINGEDQYRDCEPVYRRVLLQSPRQESRGVSDHHCHHTIIVRGHVHDMETL